MEKVKYEVDPQNRLVKKSEGLRGIRRVLDGQFKAGRNNMLVYHIKTPVPYDTKAPHQVKLKGNWSLTKDHQLRLTLDKWQRQTFGDQLTLQGEIIDVDKNSLLFAVTTRTKQDITSIYAFKLCGCWQADKRNRLTFRVDKGGENFDTLVFGGGWQIGKNYEIIYRYEKEDLLRKKKRIHNLIFKGRWDIRDRYRLSYVIDKSSDSVFDFKTGLGIFEDNYIKYELGIGLSQRKRPLKRSVIFFGKWKIREAVGLVFEVEEDNRKIQQITFGAKARFKDKNTLFFNLRNSLNKGIGAQLQLSRDIFKKDGQAFLRLLETKEELVILAGVGFSC